MVSIFQSLQSDFSVEAALAMIGFRFNPFNYLEASSDLNLARYLINDQSSEALAHNTSIVLAQTGGGKTALRLGVFRQCWAGYGNAHPFPVPIMLSRPQETYIDTGVLIGRATARTLLAALIYQPELLIHQRPSAIDAVITFLTSALSAPFSLNRFIQMLKSGEAATSIIQLFAPSCLLSNYDPPTNYQPLITALSRAPQKLIPASYLFDIAQQIILYHFGFSTLLLQIDGADADPYTLDNPSAMRAAIDWPLRQAAAFAKHRVIVTAYLPLELAEIVDEYKLPIIKISWSINRLINLIRQRVLVASGGRYDSLAVLAEPSFQDIDYRIVSLVKPLPREIILFIQCLLSVYVEVVQRGGDLSHVNLNEAYKNYRSYEVEGL